MTAHTSSKNITLFYRGLEFGGIERTIVLLANEFASKGHHVELLLYQAHGPLRKELNPAVKVTELPIKPFRFFTGGLSLRGVFAVGRYLKSQKPDLFISSGHFYNETSVVAKLLYGSKSKVVVVVQTDVFAQAQLVSRRLLKAIPLLMKLLYRFADELVCVSAALGESLKSIPLKKGKKPVVINNGVSVETIRAFAEEPVSDHWLNDSSIPVVLGVGRLTTQKNFELLVRAFATVSKKFPCRLVILGNGELESNLNSLIKSLSIDTCAKLLPFDLNPYRYMARAKVFVLSSNWEGSPLVLIEALAAGATVVATDCPTGPKEVLNNGEFGYLFPMEDQEKLEKLIEQAVTNALPEKKLNEKWFQTWDISAVANAYLELLENK
jgi:glycosyltransferase involved in cell wall biosynthesis